MNNDLKDNLNAPLKEDNSEPKEEENLKLEEPEKVDYDIFDSANFLSKLFFHWVLYILKLAKQTKLSPDLLGTVSPNNDSKCYAARIEYFWETKSYKTLPKNALMNTILRSNIWRLISVITLSLMSSGLQYLSILILKEYIDYFQNPQARTFSLLQLGIAFVVTQFLYVLISNHTNLILSFLGFRAKYELNCFIYNKVLKVSPSSFKEKASQGEIINFLQVDSNKLSGMMFVSTNLVSSPIMICAYMYLLFDFFGISFFTGLAILAFFFLLNFFLFKHYRIVSKELLEKTDGRMKLTTEVFDSIKILKLYNWENEFKQRIFSAREEEVQKIKKRLMMSTVNISLFWLCPVFVAIGTIGVYIFLEHSFDIATMLIGLALFARLQNPVRDLPWSINALLETYISMTRIEKFINQPEYVESNVVIENKYEKPYAIKIENGTFTWGKIPKKEDDKNKEGKGKKVNEKEDKTVRPLLKDKIISKENNSQSLDGDYIDQQINSNKKDEIREKINQNDSIANLLPRPTENNEDNIDEKMEIEGVDKKDYEIVLSNINLEIKQGETVGIIGEVGSGKTSLLQAILNSLILLSKDKCDGIHIAGSIGYVSQTAWIQNDTIKNNITFFNEYNEERYQQVLEQSQLKYDLNNLEGHDMTEIGEKGINLSGGQKVRVSLARALYADPDIYLLDDPISALDANIGRQIIDGCILKYLKNKTRLITTHALYFLRNLDKIIYIEKGKIKWSGTYDELIYQDFYAALSRMEKQRKKSHKKSMAEDTDIIIGEDNDDDVDDDEEKDINNEQKVAKKLMKEEDEEIGVVKKEVYIKYCVYMGSICFVLMIIGVMFLWFVNKGSSDLWLAFWSQPENQDEKKKLFFFSIYSALGVGSALFIFFRILMLSLGTVKLSLTLHKDMITSLIKAPINLFHEIVPRGQVYNRLSKDLESLQFLMYTVGNTLVALFSLLGAIGICSLYDLYSLLFIPFFTIIGYFLTSFYLIGKRVLSRIERTSYSPILNTISETIPGVISIKAFGRCQEYLNRFYKGVNDNYKVNLFYYGSETWYRFQFNMLSFLFVTYLVIYTNIFESSATPQSIGLMFTYSLILQDSLEMFFLFCTTLETQMVSMERCLSYTSIIKENASSVEEDEQLIQQAWPQAGKIEFVNYSVKYRPNTEIVLKSLSFIINPREKIGIIGRTGSGKSTICLCLFRILEPLTGTINIDDVDITKVGLDLLRQNITIIPQDPTLMQGTLRYNIDPFDTRTDDEILTILHDIGFNINYNEDALQKVIEEKGNNLSVGERQLVCIARAMLRKTKIILMDEATANIDMKTEEKIQNALKLVTAHSTILTIAHRIKTIVHYDRILVLDNGNVEEFDTPSNLLQNKDSLFYELYSKSAV